MDWCSLSSTGLQDIDSNNITSDNMTINSLLNVSINGSQPTQNDRRSFSVITF